MRLNPINQNLRNEMIRMMMHVFAVHSQDDEEGIWA